MPPRRKASDPLTASVPISATTRARPARGTTKKQIVQQNSSEEEEDLVPEVEEEEEEEDDGEAEEEEDVKPKLKSRAATKPKAPARKIIKRDSGASETSTSNSTTTTTTRGAKATGATQSKSIIKEKPAPVGRNGRKTSKEVVVVQDEIVDETMEVDGAEREDEEEEEAVVLKPKSKSAGRKGNKVIVQESDSDADMEKEIDEEVQEDVKPIIKRGRKRLSNIHPPTPSPEPVEASDSEEEQVLPAKKQQTGKGKQRLQEEDEDEPVAIVQERTPIVSDQEQQDVSDSEILPLPTRTPSGTAKLPKTPKSRKPSGHSSSEEDLSPSNPNNKSNGSTSPLKEVLVPISVAASANDLASAARMAAMNHAAQEKEREKEREGKPRLVIHQMVLEDFKSYRGRGVIGPFHKVNASFLPSFSLTRQLNLIHISSFSHSLFLQSLDLMDLENPTLSTLYYSFSVIELQKCDKVN